MISLVELLSSAGVRADALDGTARVSSICSDSRKVVPGALFVCMPSNNSDSHSFIPQAVEAGAKAVMVHSIDGLAIARQNKVAAAVVKHEGWRFNDALCKICNTFFNYPTRDMKVVGVTGTNGKTTTAWLIRDMFRALGLRAAYLGTLGFHLPDEERELPNTTPFPVELYTMLAEARDKGVEALAMEVSSHALEERRSEYVEYDAGVFTNLTQDHLDFHGSMEAYEAAKLRLFTELPYQSGKSFVAVINTGSEDGRRWAQRLGDRYRSQGSDSSQEVATFASSEEGERRAYFETLAPEIGLDRLSFWADTGEESVFVHLNPEFGPEEQMGGGYEFRAALGGHYNLENVTAACATLVALGYSLAAVKKALAQARPVPGRFEPVPNDAGISILVDYAHTPDALDKLLDAVRPLTQGKIITVFGCGGDRDRTKRPKMARAASERSDITVVTSDNPRTEDPQAILDEVVTGIMPGRESVAIIDRGEAIAHAICIASPGDVVVIAGKGHENYQIIGRTKYPMDDRELAREGLRRRAVDVAR